MKTLKKSETSAEVLPVEKSPTGKPPRKQGVSRAIPDANLRVAFEKYVATCHRQGRHERAQLASDLYRSIFDTAAYSQEAKAEVEADDALSAALQEFAEHPANKAPSQHEQVVKIVRVLTADIRDNEKSRKRIF